MKKLLTKLIDYLENLKTNLFLLIITFLAIVFSRAFLEGIFENYRTIGLHPITELSIYNFFLHFPVYYLFVFLASLVFLYSITKERIEKVGKILLFFFPIILLPPILDLFITPGKGDSLFYFMETKTLLRALYGTFLFPIALKGISYGLRIEVLTGCLLAGVYVFMKTKKFYKSLLSFFGVFLIIIFSGALPLLSGKLFSLFQSSDISAYVLIFQSGGLIPTETQRATLITLFPLILLVPLSFYLWSPQKFKAFFRNLKLLQSLHFIGMIFLGLFLAVIMSRTAGIPFITNPLDYLAIFGLFVSIFLVFESIILFEKATDNFLNPERIEEKDNLSTKELTISGVLLLACSLLFAINISYVCFILICAFSLIFFFYLSPPFRLKRFFPLSTFLLSLASLLAVITGFSLLTGEKAVYAFPWRISLLILTVFTLAFSLKDIKNITVDKKMKMFTIPTIIGKDKGKKTIAVILLLSFLIVPLILGDNLLYIPAVLIGLGTVFIIVKKISFVKIITLFYVIFALFVLFSLYRNQKIVFQNNNSSFLAAGHFYSGNTYLEKGLTNSAISSFEIAEEKGLKTSALYEKLGYAYLRKGETKKAIGALKKSLALEKDFPQTKVLLTQAYIKKGMPDSALIICNDALHYGRYKAEFYMLRGKAFLSRKDITNAINEFKKAIILGETSGNSSLALGNIYLSLGSPDKAIEAYTQAINLNDEGFIHKKRAEAFHKKGENEKALFDLITASLLDPQDPEIKNNIATIYYEMEEYRKAVDYLGDAIKLNPEYVVAYENLSNTYERMGCFQEAALVKKKVSEINNSINNKNSLNRR
ncbi:MAG: tetratricopeptide repeat protein [Candidatus Cloacimonadota bacterium]|nr:MAG: tetratricopeptide repeat protein [Candidatus Cloacimonadota bacterium]